MKKTMNIIVLMSLVFFYSFDAFSALGDFRTKSSGNWNNVAIWQRHNGSSWVDATYSPSYTDEDISILSGHAVTVTVSIIVDQVDVVGSLTLNSGVTLTVNDGSSTDLTVDNTSSNLAYFYVYGTVINQGSINKTDGIIYFYNNSVYRHAINGGNIEDAVWSTNSTCEITGYIDNSITNLDQNFGNFIWNCTAQTSTPNLSTIPVVYGNFTMKSTGIGSLTLSVSVNTNMYIYGDYIHEGGNFYPSNGSADDILYISGNFNMTGGKLGGPPSGSGSTTLVFNKSGIQTFSHTAGQNTLNNKLNFQVTSGSILDIGTGVLGDPLYTSGTFTLNSGGSLLTANANGIASSGASGCIQVAGTRSYSNLANYTFYRNGVQNTGNGLPSPLNGNLVIGSLSNATNLTINNSGSSVVENGILNLMSTSSANSSIVSGTISYGTDGTLEYKGASQQTSTNAEFPSSISKLSINNSNGVNLHSSRTINNTLTLSSGALNIGSNILTINKDINKTSGTLVGGSGSEIVFGGSGASTNLPAITLKNLTLNRVSGISIAGNVVVNENLILASGALSINSFILTFGNNATITRTGGSLSGTPLPTFGTSVNLVYNQHTSSITTGIEVPSSPSVLSNLTVNSSNNVNLNTSATINGSLILSSGLFSIGANTLTLNGIITGSGLTGGSSSNIILGGNGVSTNIPAIELNNLTINRNSGIVLNGNVVVNGSLTLTDGLFTLGINMLTLNGSTIQGNTSNLLCNTNSSLTFGGNSSGVSIPSVVNNLKSLFISNANGVILNSNINISNSVSVTGYLKCADKIISGSGSFFLGGGARLSTGHANGINGSIDLSGLKTFNSLATYEFNGMIDQITGFPVFLTPGTINSMVVSNVNSTLTLSSNIIVNTNFMMSTITGKFCIPPLKHFTVNGFSNILCKECFKIKSDSTGSGSFIDNGNLMGNKYATIERYLPNDEWHIVSSPVAMGLGARAVNFIPQGGDAYIRQFVNGNSWGPYIMDTNYQLNPTQGYPVWLTAPATVNLIGNFNSGLILSNLTVALNGWNLIGNPYPSSINWVATYYANSALINPTMYLWRQSFNGYCSYNAVTGMKVPDDPTVSEFIPSFQGFFIDAIISGPLSFNNNQRTHNDQLYYKSSNNTASLRIRANQSGNSDEMLVYFHPLSLNAFDLTDSRKFLTGGLQLYSLTQNSEKLVLNGLPENISVSVPIVIEMTNNSSTELNFLLQNLQSIVYLEDTLGNVIQNISNNPIFTLIPYQNNSIYKFILRFDASNSINDAEINDVFIVYSMGNEIFFNSNERMKEFYIYDLSGREILKSNLGNVMSKWIKTTLNTSYYIVKVISDKHVYNKKVFIKNN